MEFTRLRLTGFKSFVDPTDLMIEPGTTGIVGPNGCGKSNLVEALRWVMGEVSAKKMRGGEMDDVIFSGTSDRPARNIAEVSLMVDNADRSAPASFNDSDELEIARRIEREQGSRYVVNGLDVRARDVQLLFADAASGANSAALVGQGQVAAIINAKPQQRRGILEEAAGIKGIHSRRHEAELRLRAADNNLERVDDVIQTLEAQLQALKRQARQASRYRNISGHIRNAEAILLHLKWVTASEVLELAEGKLAEAERGVTDATGRSAAAATGQAETSTALPDLREAEASAAAGLHRLAVERENLSVEEGRARDALESLRARVAQVADDTRREEGLVADASGSLTRLNAEEQGLQTDRDGEESARVSAGERTGELAGEIAEQDAELQDLTQAAAAAEAHRAELGNQIRELGARRERLQERLREVKAELADLDGGGAEDAPASDDDIAGARAKAENARSAVRLAETERQQAGTEEGTARDALTEVEARTARLKAEADGLAGLLKVNEDDLWPPLIDALSVEAGYEAALGAALGDDLSVSADTGAPVHWRAVPPYDQPAPLPQAAQPLSGFVEAPPALSRRLSQVGVVTVAEGTRLAGTLVQGQRLVTKEGALWRWDGFTAVADATTPAAARLSQRNTLAELRAAIADLESEVSEARRVFDLAREHSGAAATAETETRRIAQEAEDALNALREAAAGAAREAAERTSRIAVLREASGQAAGDLEETDSKLSELEGSQTTQDSGDEAKAAISSVRRTLEALRTQQASAEAERESLSRDAAARASRLAAIAGERTGWQERIAAAESQIKALARRRQEAEAEIEPLESIPAGIAERRGDLGTMIETAEEKRRDAAAALAETEDELAARDRALKAAQQALAEVRENRVRFESGLEAANQSLKEIAALIAERLDCRPQEALARSDHKDGKELPDAPSMETRIDRLRAERERMGPVNLRAELEAQEIREQIDTLQEDRSDLEAAIARLRQGISGLNREGRERLLASFNTVDAHFRDLFVRLFGGGRAHLALTESEDPLEAGLEIMASPPGKRLQTMSLLSGGEQALTALCLLFAVFLTNPAPICVLDEVDAPLDESNVERFCDLVDDLSRDSDTRFLIITHNSVTMSRMDRLFGVTMAERGVSQLVSVDLARAERLRDTG